MKTNRKLTQSEMVLLAIYRAAGSTTNRVAFDSIVLQAWRDFPKTFSLNNHPEYPDSYPISKRIYTNLIKERLVVSLHKQVYRLTEKGLRLSQELEDQHKLRKAISQPSDIRLTKEDQEFLQHAIRSRTYSAWKQGNRQKLIDYDTRVFFQFSTGTPVRERKRKLDNAKEAIEKAVVTGLPEGVTLRDLFNFLVEKFPGLFEEV